MDVACSRCHAEYEFDDALISERGTTVFCTTCGLQFKIFPPERSAEPEEWTLTPAVPGTTQRTFRSLRELQRAILDGDVDQNDLLARGAERPRRLGAIAELEPLLKRPRSAMPPARDPARATRLGGAEGPLRRTAGGTVMGLAAPRVPNFGAPAPPPGSLPPAVSDARDGPGFGPGDEEAIVPSSPTETAHPGPPEPWQAPPTQTLRPKIQSVLSRSPAAVPPPDPTTQNGPPSSSRLRATLASNSAPPSTPGRQQQKSSSGSPESAPDGPGSRHSRFDSEPFSVVPGTRPRPLARGGWIVISVLVGAAAFVLTAARERVFALFSDGERGQSVPQLLSSERALLAQVELADEAWLSARVAEPAARPAKLAVLEARLVALKQALDEGRSGPLGKTQSWAVQRVHYLRMVGDVPGARAALGQVKGAPAYDPYLLAVLDLADQAGQRPFSSILRRLKDASSGERGRYRMTSAYVVALVEAGQLAQAQEEFARMSQNADAESAPLYGDLARYLDEKAKPAALPTKAAP